MKQSTPLTAGAIYLFIYLTLLMVTVFVPYAVLITMFLLPLPFIVYSVRFGWKAAAGLSAVTLLVASLLVPGISLPFTFIAVFGGFMVGMGINQQLSAYEAWARGTVGYLIGLVSTFLFIQGVFGINIIDETRTTIQSSLQSSQEMMESFGLNFGEEEMTAITEQMENLLNLFPVFFVLTALLLAFVTQWISYKLINKIEKKQLKFPPFRTFQLPIAVIWIYFIAILATLFSGEESSTVYLAAINVTNLAGFLVAIQGLSFLFFYVHKKKLSKTIPVVAIVITVIFPLIGLYLLRILGIIDLGFSLRNRMENKD